MILLQANDVARRFNGQTFFEHISMQVKDKARIGLVGRNGAGKSTLLKMLIGQEAPDAGEVSLKKGTKLAYLAQNSGLDSDLSVYNEMLTAFAPVIALEDKMRKMETEMATMVDYEGEHYQKLLAEYDQAQHDFDEQNGYGYDAAIRGVLHGFGFDDAFYDRKINTLSGGQRTRLAIAKQLLETPDLLILDEPTNHLDMETLAWLEQYLQNYTGALVIVSHDRYFLDRVVNEIYDMHSGQLDHYHGNYSQFMALKAQKVLAEEKAYQKQQAEISKLEDFVAKNIVRASTTKRAQSRRKQLERMEKIEPPKNESGVAHITFQAAQESGSEVLQVTDVELGYDQTKPLAKNVNLQVMKQHAVALVGPNGIGKSTLIKTLLGQIPAIAGSIKLGSNVEVGYYDQEQAVLDPSKTVLDTVWDEHPTMPERDIRTILGSFMFSGETVDKKVKALSGGEKARLLLTKLSLEKANFLILDEPTNHLDIDSREVLETALNEYNGTIFFVSHDRYFINAVASEIVELTPAGTQFYDGDYDYYLEKKAVQATVAQTEKSQPTNQPARQQNSQAHKTHQRQVRKLQRQLTELEGQLDQLAADKDTLTQELNAPANAQDIDQLTALAEQIEALDGKITTVENEWAKVSEELEMLEQE
ncbi:ABC-F family ATP-binding cassette domain-containing protein [Weissella halotolerans]|uniref:Abc superfamily atp binding cassette transporter, abc protein n=1 Tax=Weissella halotolerans DSM 20190 TaxID=1123500 RepID=A0A0R2FVT1_9LACO|nr:ABC-F family ATP-binding cassette domain-containing protein [Weissella halotolerans]KRN32521.1 abc superfamily atp binding cassette transporter, abc protein [Weissella halotolerans DSM 20190]